MDLFRQSYDGLDVIRVDEPRIDAAVAIQFKDMMRVIVANTPGRVVLDLGRVGFIDSSGLGALVAVLKLLAPDRKLELAAVTPAVERVLKLTRMDELMPVHAVAPHPSGAGGG